MISKEMPKYQMERPKLLPEPSDDLRKFSVKIVRRLLRFLQPFAGPKHTDLWWLGRLASRLLGKDIFDTRLLEGGWICLPLPVYTSHFLFGGDLKRFGKDNIHPVMMQKAKSGTIAIDVGASCGQEVVTLSKAVGDEGTVYCFEPSYSYHALLRTVAINQLENVVCIQAAVGAKCGYMNAESEQAYLIGADSKYMEAGDVPVLALDDFFASINEDRCVSIMKIDTDGFELEVIRGSKKILESNPDINIVTEFESQFDYSGLQGIELLKEYKRMGFTISKIQTTAVKLKDDELEEFLGEMRNPLKMIAHDIVLSKKDS